MFLGEHVVDDVLYAFFVVAVGEVVVFLVVIFYSLFQEFDVVLYFNLFFSLCKDQCFSLLSACFCQLFSAFEVIFPEFALLYESFYPFFLFLFVF